MFSLDKLLIMALANHWTVQSVCSSVVSKNTVPSTLNVYFPQVNVLNMNIRLCAKFQPVAQIIFGLVEWLNDYPYTYNIFYFEATRQN